MPTQVNAKCIYIHLKPFCIPGLYYYYYILYICIIYNYYTSDIISKFLGKQAEIWEVTFFSSVCHADCSNTQETFGALQETQMQAKPQIRCYYKTI